MPNDKPKRNIKKTPRDTDFQTGFAFGNLYWSTKAELNAIGAASGGAITAYDLAKRMAALLLSEESGAILGDTERLPQVRAYASGFADVHPVVEPKAVHVRSHGGRTLSAKARKLISKAQRARWKKWREAGRKPFLMTPARLRAARANAAKARAAYIAKAALRKAA